MLERIAYYNQQREANGGRVQLLQEENKGLRDRIESQAGIIKNLQEENTSLNKRLKQLEVAFEDQRNSQLRQSEVKRFLFSK